MKINALIIALASNIFLFAFHLQKGHTKLPDYVPVGQFQKAPLRDLFTAASADCLNLLGKCLLYEPRKRISAKEVGFGDSRKARSRLIRFILVGSKSPILLCTPQPHSPFETP